MNISMLNIVPHSMSCTHQLQWFYFSIQECGYISLGTQVIYMTSHGWREINLLVPKETECIFVFLHTEGKNLVKRETTDWFTFKSEVKF